MLMYVMHLLFMGTINQEAQTCLDVKLTTINVSMSSARALRFQVPWNVLMTRHAQPDGLQQYIRGGIDTPTISPLFKASDPVA